MSAKSNKRFVQLDVTLDIEDEAKSKYLVRFARDLTAEDALAAIVNAADTLANNLYGVSLLEFLETLADIQDEQEAEVAAEEILADRPKYLH